MINMQEIQIDDFTTHNLSSDDINKAFNLMKEGKKVSTLCYPHAKKIPSVSLFFLKRRKLL